MLKFQLTAIHYLVLLAPVLCLIVRDNVNITCRVNEYKEFPSESGCSCYYRCINGTLYHQVCLRPFRMFDPVKKKCDWAWRVKCNLTFEVSTDIPPFHLADPNDEIATEQIQLSKYDFENL